jgi:hypothetical protein
LSFCAAVLCSGCTSLVGLRGASSNPPPAVDTPAGEAAAAPATVQVTLKPKDGKPKQKTLPFTPGMSVQSALEQTAATRKFTDMEIKVYRVTPYSKGMPVPLQSDYDPSKNRVPILNDMSLHPGDMVLIEENDNSQLDLMLAKLTGNAAKRRGLK